MKAITFHDYGSSDVLRCEEVEKPTPGDNEVLIKVCAASANPLDWHLMRGEPFPIRIMGGLSKPKNARLGVDVAGMVAAVGAKVTQFKPDDEVFGSCHGAFAEYAVTPEKGLVIKPANLTFEEAAAAPVAAFTALQGLRDKGRIQPGQTILINGASGGVGTFAVQIAKSLGAYVTGVCSARNVEMVRSLGADQVIDYNLADFTKLGQRYDLIFDCVGNHSLLACRRAMKPKGVYIIVGAPSGRWIAPFDRLIRAILLSLFASQKFVMLLSRATKEDLRLVSDLMETGKVTAVIDKRYSLNEVPEAIRYLEEGHARGKLIIALSQ